MGDAAPDYDVDNYSLDDLLELIGANASDSKEDIQEMIDGANERFSKLGQPDAANFFPRCF